VRMRFAKRAGHYRCTHLFRCSGTRTRAWSEPNRMLPACLHSLHPPYQGPSLLVPHPRADPARRGKFSKKSSEDLKAG
jgi:hypothetical protein